MDRYVYLILSLSFFIIWLIIYIFRRDLRKKLLLTGLVGILAGVISEQWYYQDYWQPINLVGVGIMSLEDIIFGFSLVGISACIYDFIFVTKNIPSYSSRTGLFILFFFLGIASLIVFTTYQKINSVIVSSTLFILFAIIMIAIRRDLIKPAITSAFIAAILSLIIYIIIFNFIAPNFWDKHWLLKNTRYNLMVWHFPILEIIWFFAWGLLGSIAHEFVTGDKKIKI